MKYVETIPKIAMPVAPFFTELQKQQLFKRMQHIFKVEKLDRESPRVLEDTVNKNSTFDEEKLCLH